MTDDLVKRLRRTYRKEYAPTRSMCGDNSNKPFPFPILATEVPVNPDGHEAADRIEALTAEIEGLRKALEEAPIIGLRESGEEFKSRQDNWLKTKAFPALGEKR
jgi:hypothetical protein